MPRDNKIWDERSRPALIPKWGGVRCELLDQGENDGAWGPTKGCPRCGGSGCVHPNNFDPPEQCECYGIQDNKNDCTTFSVAQALLALGVKEAIGNSLLPNLILGEVSRANANPTSIGDNLEACVRLGYITGRISTSYWPSYLKAVALGPVILGLHQYIGMEKKYSTDFICIYDPDESIGKHAVCCTGLEKRWFGRDPRFAYLMDTRASVGRCKLSLAYLKLLFDRGEAICFVPVVK